MNRVVLLNPKSLLSKTKENEYDIHVQINATNDIGEIKEIMKANLQKYSSEIFHLRLTKKELENTAKIKTNLLILCSHGLVNETFMFDEQESIVAQYVTAREISNILKNSEINLLLVLACHSKPIADAIRKTIDDDDSNNRIQAIVCIDSHEKVADDVTPHFIKHLLGEILNNNGVINETIFKETVLAMSKLPHLSKERQEHQLSKFVYSVIKQNNNVVVFQESKINGFSMNDLEEDEVKEKAKIQKFFINFMLSGGIGGKVLKQEDAIRSLSEIDLKLILKNQQLIQVVWTIKTLRNWWQNELLLGFDGNVHESILNDKTFVFGDCILRLSSKSENARRIVLVYYNSKRNHTNIYLNVNDDGLIEISYEDGSKKKFSSLLHALINGTQPPIERVCYMGRMGKVEKKTFEQIEDLFLNQ